MFRLSSEVRRQFLEMQALLDARGDKQWIEHYVYVPSLDGTERESELYHRIARRVARRIKRRFRCKTAAVKYRQFADCAPSIKVVVSFI